MEISSPTGLQSSIVRSSQAFTGIANATPGSISVLLAQVQGLALDSVNIASGNPTALAANQDQMQRALLNLRDLAPLRDSSVAMSLAQAIHPELVTTPFAHSVAVQLRP